MFTVYNPYDFELVNYILNLNGFIVLDNILTPNELSLINSIIESKDLPPPKNEFPRFGSGAGATKESGSGLLEWGQPFIDLLSHQVLLKVLRGQLGDCFRIDRLYGIYMNKNTLIPKFLNKGHLHADYGANSPNSSAKSGEYYPLKPYQVWGGVFVALWNLVDTGPGKGGFCCVPGTHQSHYRVPDIIMSKHAESPWVKTIEAKAGSLIIFSEALLHGTAPWQTNTERRGLIYKYSISNLVWGTTRVIAPKGIMLTEVQKKLLSPPGEPYTHFDSLF